MIDSVEGSRKRTSLFGEINHTHSLAMMETTGDIN